MIALYHNDMSVCAQKVRFALAEKKLKWENRHLSLRAGDQQKPEYLKLNPNAVVPTLVEFSPGFLKKSRSLSSWAKAFSAVCFCLPKVKTMSSR